MIMGSVIASFTVQNFGTKSLESLDQNKLKERIQLFKSLSEFDIMQT